MVKVYAWLELWWVLAAVKAGLHFEVRAPCAVGGDWERCLGSKPGNLCQLLGMIKVVWWLVGWFVCLKKAKQPNNNKKTHKKPNTTL